VTRADKAAQVIVVVAAGLVVVMEIELDQRSLQQLRDALDKLASSCSFF